MPSPFPSLMDGPDDVVLRINYNGVFKYDILRITYGPCSFCIHGLDIESGGLKIIENDADVHALYDLAEKHLTVDLFATHSPHNLAQYYHHNICLSGSDEEVTSKKKEHEIKKKDVGNMSFEELVVWAEEEANSPYLRSPPLKSMLMQY
ncbi:hypothetical protein Tco_0374788 [Tanacetum coccineum]